MAKADNDCGYGWSTGCGSTTCTCTGGRTVLKTFVVRGLRTPEPEPELDDYCCCSRASLSCSICWAWAVNMGGYLNSC